MGEAGRNDSSGLTRLPGDRSAVSVEEIAGQLLNRAETPYTVRNVERGYVIATQVCIAGTSCARRKGLLGRQDIEEGAGLWIAPCEAIHTFGMKMRIDVLFLDAKFRILKIVEAMRPRRIAICLAASSVLELDPGAIGRSGAQVGDRLKFEPWRQS